MGYHVVDPDALDSTPDHSCDRRSISEAVDLTTLAAAVYTLDPGEELAQSYHYHEQREELFYVISGSLTVETPEENYTVTTDSAFVSEPKSPIRPYNPETSSEPVRVLGVGAPKFDIGRQYDPETDEHPTDAE